MNRQPKPNKQPTAREFREQRPTLRELEVLRSVIDSGKTTVAAQKLGMSQPAVSRVISSLEERLGRVLFARSNGRLVPSPDAMALDAQAAVIFNLVDNLAGITDGSEVDSHIRIAASPTLAHQFLGLILSKFAQQEPSIRVHVEIGRTPDCLAAVADGAADIGVIDQSPVRDGVRLEVFRRSRAHVVLPQKHRLASRSKIGPKDLAGENLIALSRRFSLRTRIDAAFAANRIEPKIVAEGATSALLTEMVKHGVGVTVVNPFPLELGDFSQLVLRPFDPEIPMETALAVSASAPLKPAARALANFIRRDQPPARFSSIVK